MKSTWEQLNLDWLSDSKIDLIKKEMDSGGRVHIAALLLFLID